LEGKSWILRILMKPDYKNYHRDSDYVKYSSTFRNIFLTRFALIYKFVKSGRVLEIGSSTGIFLEIFKEKGFEVFGVESSRSAVEAKKKGIKVYRDYFEKLNLPRNYFDLVLLNHTLEHMDDPVLVLKKVNTLLKKGGILFVDVPNAGSLSAKIMGDSWPFRLPSEHKWQFTKQSILKLFSKTGFKVLLWQSRSGIFEYANPFQELKRKSFIYDIVTFPLALVSKVLNMGDSMTVIARKL